MTQTALEQPLNMRAVYVFGPPGVGKTTAVSTLIQATFERPTFLDMPFKATVLPARGTLILGHYMPGQPFAGTDSLPFNVIRTVQRSLLDVCTAFGCQFVLAEGDRLACPGFFSWLRSVADPFLPVLLTADPALIAQRRRNRVSALGRQQDTAWVAGRDTKTTRLAAQFQHQIIDAAQPQDAIAIARLLWHDATQ